MNELTQWNGVLIILPTRRLPRVINEAVSTCESLKPFGNHYGLFIQVLL